GRDRRGDGWEGRGPRGRGLRGRGRRSARRGRTRAWNGTGRDASRASRRACGMSRAADMIRARGLSKRYGAKRVLEELDLALPRGGFLLVTGPNGSGKTTLLRLCAGLATPTAGELEVDADRAAIGFLGHEPLVYRRP